MEVTSNCIDCGQCIEFCPVQAIEITESGPKIDQTKCTGCRKCVGLCPGN